MRKIKGSCFHLPLRSASPHHRDKGRELNTDALTPNVQVQILLLLPAAFLLPPGAWAGEIIGGREAQPHSRPYMAYLDIQRGNKNYSCGGFLVVENFVLTAAHCNGDKITVTLGAHIIREHRQQTISMRHRIPHPQYNNETCNNDIMLLQLSQSAVLNNWVQLIPLQKTNSRVMPGSMCSVAGWGWTGQNSNTDTFCEVDVEVMRDNMCELYPGYNPSRMPCVVNPTLGKLPNQGDSGGPLVCEGVTQGITLYVDGNFYHPSMFTRLSTFIPWIQNILQKEQ
ncbi:mast cell protease 3-like [Trachemys scripta elegans]|uniref:mast cell protease 3-like n=1 Tax=Trachemys scripta elegans TaxID=31138 RepID=UPI0015581C9C|nr:mast cell protease 3-like [Trachemys scripta elegans]